MAQPVHIIDSSDCQGMNVRASRPSGISAKAEAK